MAYSEETPGDDISLKTHLHLIYFLHFSLTKHTRAQVYSQILVLWVQRGQLELFDLLHIARPSSHPEGTLTSCQVVLFSVYMLSELITALHNSLTNLDVVCEHVSELCFYLLELTGQSESSYLLDNRELCDVKWVKLFHEVLSEEFGPVISKRLLGFAMHHIFLAAYTNSKTVSSESDNADEEVCGRDATVERNKRELFDVIKRRQEVRDSVHLYNTAKSLCLFASSEVCLISQRLL